MYKVNTYIVPFLLFLAFFHIPIVKFSGDSIGLYDIFICIVFFALIVKIHHESNIDWKIYFFVWFGYSVYLALHLIFFVDTYSILIVIKTIQYGITFYVWKRLIKKIDELYLLRTIIFITIAYTLFQLCSFFPIFKSIGIQPGFGWGVWFRVGIPFAEGTSSNPAGFILGCLIIYFSYYSKYLRMTGYVAFLLCMAALLLTVSRTNIFALFIIVMISSFIKGFLNIRNFILIIFIVFLGYFLIQFAISIVDRNSTLWYLLSLFQDGKIIQRVLENGSFQNRYQIIWIEAFDVWLQNPLSIFFGQGEGFMKVVDGTLPRLLVNQGIAGVIFFGFVWYIPFIKNNLDKIGILVFFSLINGINGETLVVSFRAIQVYIPIFLGLIFASVKNKKTLFFENERALIV